MASLDEGETPLQERIDPEGSHRVMGGPDTTVGCLEARAEGADPQAPDWSAGVEVGAVVELVSLTPP
ncbi:UNVERIFIED_CONTAM: hypothetical protein FKN15_070880 [Acipenser sinensis]